MFQVFHWTLVLALFCVDALAERRSNRRPQNEPRPQSQPNNPTRPNPGNNDRDLRTVNGPVEDRDYINNGNFLANKVELGRKLFNDPILSGNRNISCATCHSSSFGTSDALSLGIGEGGEGEGIHRQAASVQHRVPRNSPALFNLGARELDSFFYDGRVERLRNNQFRSPAGNDLPAGLDNIIAVQALFPLTSNIEMAGDANDNPIGLAASRNDLAGENGVWNLIVRRIVENENYRQDFQSAYPELDSIEDISISHVANAIAAFEADEFRSSSSPFDDYLRGNNGALSDSALRGMRVFYRQGSCVECHSGKFQSDFEFHSIGVPQIGPGKGDGNSGLEDFGRERVTGNRNDRYEFRTPSLRNVELTGPWGHSGAFTTLREMVSHYVNPQRSLEQYDPIQARPVLPFISNSNDFDLLGNQTVTNSIANEINLRNGGGRRGQNNQRRGIINQNDVDDIVEFLKALTDPRFR